MANFKTFVYPLFIREHHLDTFGHVNNATYLELLEEARWEFLNTQGLSLKKIHEMGVGPVVLECTIKFLQEIHLRQSISIESTMISYEKKIGIMQQNIYNEQRELCSEAQLTFGFFDLKARKLILPTPQWLQAIGMELTEDDK